VASAAAPAPVVGAPNDIPGRTPRAWTAAVDRAIGAITEPLCALLIVAEVAILAAGVLFRYAFHNALIWTDELSGILLLWLGMVGGVVAYRRREHIRITALERIVSPATRDVLDAVSSVIVLLFCVEMLPATYNLFVQETSQVTPVLNLPRSWVIAGIIVPIGLVLILAVLRLVESERRHAVPAAIAGIAISLAAVASHDVFTALGNLNLVVFFVLFVGAVVAIGVPIAFAFGAATLSYLALTTHVPLSTVADRMNEGIANLILLAVPLFILLGLLIDCSGIARRLVDAIAALVGHVRGGLNIVLVVAMYLVSGISGSKTADMAAIAPVLFPEMERRGQKRAEMIALLSTSAAMAETIPPSIVLIVVGTVVGLSIKDLFSAGLLPAVVASIALVIVALARSRHDRAELAPRRSMRAIARALWIALPGLLLPVLIRTFVIEGIATTTEVSTVGIVYTIFVGLVIYRDFDWRRVYPILIETASLSGAILLIIATATAMAWALTQSGFAQQLASALASMPGGSTGFMAASIVAFVVLGSVLEGIPAMVLFGPLLFPIAIQVGINPIHYAIVAVLAMGIGLFAPPIGVGYYAACAIGKAPANGATGRVLPYIAALAVALVLIAAFPQISLVLVGAK
jgi:tripartite ATP-independent transporter DctM subunit